MSRKSLLIVCCALLVTTTGCSQLLPPKPQPHTSTTVPSDGKDRTVISLYLSKTVGQNRVTKPVTRTVAAPSSNKLVTAMEALLEGPTEAERKAGLSSEIPKGTKLLGVKYEKGAVYINLSQEYTSGGGSSSMIQRLEEVTKTALAMEPKRPVYLQVEGKPLTVLGGEGLEVPQPLAPVKVEVLR